MTPTVSVRLDAIPVRNAKAQLRGGEGAVQKLTDELAARKRAAGEALDLARANARLEPKQMAGTLGLSHSLVLRAFKGEADLGFLRLWELDDTFWNELLVSIAIKRQIAVVRTTIEIERDRKERSA